MHMADALVSPAVGGAAWVATAATTAWCARKVREEMDDRKVPLMGVLGAFVFAAQMVNFTIPATGSSGHLGGGMILAILLGPHAAFLVMASVLTVQALFFADGGLLALGCNICNLGFLPAFVAYPFLYRPVAGNPPTAGRIGAASMVSAVAALQLGAFGVVLQTTASGISELPFPTFVAFMQPIHLGIGIVEGLVTAAVVSFVWKSQPAILEASAARKPFGDLSVRTVLVVFAAAALLSGGILSRFASTRPDGLEWSVAKASGKGGPEAAGNVHRAFRALQEKLAFLPDYGSRKPDAAPGAPPEGGKAPAFPAPDGGTGVAGIVGGVITLAVAALAGLLLRKRGGAG